MVHPELALGVEQENAVDKDGHLLEIVHLLKEQLVIMDVFVQRHIQHFRHRQFLTGFIVLNK